MAFVVCNIACQKQPEAGVDVAPVHLVGSLEHLEPEDYLRAVFNRYRSAHSYRDKARVGLTYQRGGREESQWAPLSVELSGENFYIEAYLLRCFCDSERTMSWIRDPLTGDYDYQVSVTPAPPSRGDWTHLFEDPIFGEHLSAGLGGPPPQLDWLFAADPMKKLFDERHVFEFGSTRVIENQPCQCVIVRADTMRYLFWIDPAESLIRRVDLPSVIAPPEPGMPPQEMTLAVELAGATFQPSSTPPRTAPLPRTPKFVNRFVLLPPERPNPRLGGRMTSEIGTSLRNVFPQTPANERSLAIVVCETYAPASDFVSQWLASWRDQLPEAMRTRVAIAQVVSPVQDSSTQSGAPIAGVQRIASEVTRWAEACGLRGRGIAIITSDGSLQWTHENLLGADLPILGTILSDLLSGVDVPGRLRSDWSLAQKAYENEIERRRVVMD